MGIRTYIYGCEFTNIPAKKPSIKTSENGVCLGKLVAYTELAYIPQMDTIKWLGQHLTNKEDREYLAQYYDNGYCDEYIIFNQIFKHDEILDFIECYYNDKVKYSPFKSMYGIKDVILLLENYDYFAIEWTGG